MKHKPIRVDWDELEVAFNNQNVELVYYLDLITGHVGLEGEGEEDEGDDDEHYDRAIAAATATAPRDDSTRATIAPLDTADKLGWMERFLDEVDVESEAREALRQASAAAEPAPAISAVLREHAEARDRWYLYRAEQLRERMTRWLEEQGVTPSEPPPWS